MARTPRTRTAGAGEQGVAIPIILWVMVMMLAFSVVAATAANNAQHASQYQKSRDAALAAADSALRAGDFAGFGRAFQALRRVLTGEKDRPK